MLELNEVAVRYPGSAQDALSDITLTFDKGEFVCILGKSGSGKSTMIRCINGLQEPTYGEVRWDGQPLSKMSEEQLRKVRRQMGMIFQHFNLIPRLTVMQNVLTGTFGYRSNFKNLIGWFSDQEKKQAKQVIEDVDLSSMADRRVERLSGGQKQRVGIARALLQQPQIMLGDEPVSSLDPGTSNHIFSLLEQMHRQRHLLTIINVHDVGLAKRYATRIVALKAGEIIFDGKPEEFTDREYFNTYESNEVNEKTRSR
ncbi:phosphonate ABC transporter ATP-binding protein [Sediminibacillus halophilus]|uniref:Phosphonate transport system ATP-binding protein n=1 Tax=Sediminibacillus halophilus TaxID=482461 RepID=A0A1G9N6Z6_9BACI|nr:phosphonate ABC transporter ATP-binding protein [Sediminibacillus halophilus]SDL82174.1 phosphonate transport system ATP-binding protein [Sediminibacillus halophilus]